MGEPVGNAPGQKYEQPDKHGENQRDAEIHSGIERKICINPVANHAVDHPSSDECETGITNGQQKGSEEQGHKVAFQMQGAADYFPPQTRIELSLEIVFLLNLGGHEVGAGGARLIF